MSTSGSSVCKDGLVDDNFLVYTTIPCSLRLNVHVGLSIFWVICFGLLLFELVVSRLLGHFSKFHAAKKSTGSVLARDLAYLPMVIGCFMLFMIVVCDPQASVQDRVGTGLWIAVSSMLSGLLGLSIAFTVFNTQPLLTTVGIHSSTFKQADFNGKVFLVVRVLQFVVIAIFSTISAVTLVILTNTLVNFHDRQVAVDVCFISFGIAFAISMTCLAITTEAIIIVIDARIQFEQDLPAHANNLNTPTPLSVARTRLRVCTILIPIFGLFSCVAYILIGTNVIPLDWIVAHVVFGFFSASGSLLYRLIMRDSILDASCCLVQASPHQSSKDRDASDHGSGGKVAAIQKVSGDYSMEPSSPSEMLAKLDLSSFKTPSHALLTMPEESHEPKN